MKDTISKFAQSVYLQLTLYLSVNGLFIYKYIARADANPLVYIILYAILILGFSFLYFKFSHKLTEKIFKVSYFIVLLIAVSLIIFLLHSVNPYTIHVDRWSALSFFWDYFFQGKYPYAAHTHVSVTNFPSPFPVWHVLNLPFYLLGDVGIGLIFFLLLTAISIKLFFKTYRQSLFFMLLLVASTGYWWEVLVRSDSLNNALLVFVVLLWIEKKHYSINQHIVLIAVIIGLIASTRLTALLPVALYFFAPYLNLSLKQKIIFPILIFSTALLTFLPFILWDIHTWIFFSRNPFMSQADKGYWSILLIMITLGIILSLSWKNITDFFGIASLFVFTFILVSQFGLYLRSDMDRNFITHNLCDISYFNLILPYTLATVASKLKTNV
jgi:hypothetical protein